MAGFSIPLSLFDFFGILLPGIVTTLSLYLITNPSLSYSGHTRLVTTTALGGFSSDLFALIAFVIWCYLLGYAVTNFSQHIIEKTYRSLLWGRSITAVFDRVQLAYSPKEAKSDTRENATIDLQQNQPDAFAELVAQFATERFGEGLSSRELFALCLSLLTEHAPANRAGIQIAVVTSQMFQGLALAFLIMLVIVIVCVMPVAPPFLSWSLLVASVLFFIGSIYGYDHYKRIYYGSVFHAYVAYESERRLNKTKENR